MFRRIGVWVLALAIAGAAIVPVTDAGTMDKAAGGITQQAASRVGINTAGAQELASLPGIGEVTAQAIVDYRDKNGPFQKVDDLLQVKGIGEKKLGAIKDLITLK